MPPVVADPNNLTKEQLRRELSEHGVEAPPLKAKKTVFVELYRQHVLQSSNSDRLGFSSDEEDISISSRSIKKKASSPKKSPTKNKSQNMEEVIVQSLSDEELKEQLEHHNVEFGPITDSTRSVYERKLLRVLAGETSPKPSQSTDYVDYSDDYDEDADADIDEVPDKEPFISRSGYTERVIADTRYTEPMLRGSQYTERSEVIKHRVTADPEPSWKSMTKLSRDDIHSSGYSRASRYVSSSVTTSQTSAKSVLSQVRESQAKSAGIKQKKKGLSIWVQLIIVVIIALIIFMVFQNMEPANKLPTRGINHSK